MVFVYKFLDFCSAVHILHVMAHDMSQIRSTADNLGDQKGKQSSTDASEETVEATVGFRSITVSPDGNHLAAGDSSGNLRIFDLNSLLLHSFQVGITTVRSINYLCDNKDVLAVQDFEINHTFQNSSSNQL